MSDSRGKLRPILSGPGVACDGVLTVLAPQGQLVVRAHQRFLRGLVDWCDGSRDVDALAALAQREWGDNNFVAFVLAMHAAHVLVHAPLRLLQGLWHPAASALAASAGAVSSPFASFGRNPIARRQLESLLSSLRLPELESEWDASGETALKVSVVLRQGVGSFPAGVHEVRSNAEGGALLRHRGPVASAIYRAMPDPVGFGLAAGLLIVSAELENALMDDRVLAPRQALLGAGVVRHRAKESALREGLAWADDLACPQDVLQQCCGLGSQCVLYVAAFGLPAASLDGESAACSVSWMDDPAYRGLFIAKATAPGGSGTGTGTGAGTGTGIVAWGRSYDARLALDKAIGELAERTMSRAPAHVIEAKAFDLPNFVDPGSLVQYARHQYANPALNVKPFDPHKPHWWIEGKRGTSGDPIWLPADCVLGRANLPVAPGLPLLARPTSSGCASDVALGSAIERGAYELIERDALARHWLAQAPARVIDQASLPARIQHRAQELEALGCETFVLCMTLGLGPSILVLIRNLGLGFVCAGSACGSDAAATVERAFIEAEFAAITRCQGVAVPKIRSRDASVPEDHAHLYAQRAHFRRADVLIGDPAQAVALARIDWPASLQWRLGEQHRLYWVDRSDDGALRQLDGQRIRTVRVLIPGCVPLAFGYDALPRAMVSHPVSVRAVFPHPLA